MNDIENDIETTICCDNCGDCFEEDSLVEFDGKLWCEGCQAENLAVCYNCGDIIYVNHVEYSELTREDYCRDCYHDMFFWCESCDQEHHRDDYAGDGLCCGCYEDDGGDRHVHWRHYKLPGETTKLYYGIELEVGSFEDDGPDVRRYIRDRVDTSFFAIKDDGSIYEGDGIRGGAEVVSHPATYNYLMNNKHLWNTVLGCTDNAIYSYKLNTCGIHIHVSRDYFTKDHLERLLRMVYLQPAFTRLISQRKGYQLNQWAKLNTVWAGGKRVKPTKHVLKDKANENRPNNDRYEAVNLTNYDTIEFRLFRGTMSKTAFWKNLEYVHALIEFTRINKKYSDLTLKNFVKFVRDRQDDFPNMIKWLRRRVAKLKTDKIPKRYAKIAKCISSI